MAVCDAKMRFTNVISNWPGSVHYSRIFYYSSQKLEDGAYPAYLLGNSDYACKAFLMTRVLDPQTDQKSRFNASHIRTRNN